MSRYKHRNPFLRRCRRHIRQSADVKMLAPIRPTNTLNSTIMACAQPKEANQAIMTCAQPKESRWAPTEERPILSRHRKRRAQALPNGCDSQALDHPHEERAAQSCTRRMRRIGHRQGKIHCSYLELLNDGDVRLITFQPVHFCAHIALKAGVQGAPFLRHRQKRLNAIPRLQQLSDAVIDDEAVLSHLPPPSLNCSGAIASKASK